MLQREEANAMCQKDNKKYNTHPHAKLAHLILCCSADKVTTCFHACGIRATTITTELPSEAPTTMSMHATGNDTVRQACTSYIGAGLYAAAVWYTVRTPYNMVRLSREQLQHARSTHTHTQAMTLAQLLCNVLVSACPCVCLCACDDMRGARAIATVNTYTSALRANYSLLHRASHNTICVLHTLCAQQVRARTTISTSQRKTLSSRVCAHRCVLRLVARSPSYNVQHKFCDMHIDAQLRRTIGGTIIDRMSGATSSVICVSLSLCACLVTPTSRTR